MNDVRLDQVRNLPFHRFLGVTNMESRDGNGRFELIVGDASANPGGFLHGGVTYALCDVVCYVALLSVISEKQEGVTADLHVSVLQPARRGDEIVFSGKIVKLGKRLAFFDATATAGETLIATARVTKTIIDLR